MVAADDDDDRLLLPTFFATDVLAEAFAGLPPQPLRALTRRLLREVLPAGAERVDADVLLGRAAEAHVDLYHAQLARLFRAADPLAVGVAERAALAAALAQHCPALPEADRAQLAADAAAASDVRAAAAGVCA